MRALQTMSLGCYMLCAAYVIKGDGWAMFYLFLAAMFNGMLGYCEEKEKK